MVISKLARAGLAGGAVLALLGTAITAQAAAPEGVGFYVAADLSLNKADVNKSDFDDVIVGTFQDLGFDVLAGDSDLDDSDVGYSIALGYQFTRHVAVEAAYISLGDTTYHANGTLDDGENLYDVSIGAKVSSSGPAVSLIGLLPLTDVWTLDARAGAYFAKTKIRMSISDVTGSVADSGSDEDTSVLLGAGVSYSIAYRWAVRAGINYFIDGVGDRDVCQLAVGMKLSF